MNYPLHVDALDSASILTAARFSCSGVGETRKDLLERRETKFAMQCADVGKLRKLLEASGRRQIHNESVSTVRSIYFDDFALSACHANLQGLGTRRKLRLRWYDSPLPGNSVWLEVKWRQGRVTGKHRVLVSGPQAFSEWSYREMTNGLLGAVPQSFVPDLIANPEPTAIVEYRREHFASSDGRMRVTIDYDLAFYDQTGKRRISLAFPYRLGNFLVLEGKTQIGDERKLQAFLFPFTQRATRCSKYVYACRSLGLIRDRE